MINTKKGSVILISIVCITLIFMIFATGLIGFVHTERTDSICTQSYGILCYSWIDNSTKTSEIDIPIEYENNNYTHRS